MKDTIFTGTLLVLLVLVMGTVVHSIYAKETKYRDCKEHALDRGYPDYEMINNKCYGTNKMESILIYTIKGA